MYSEYQFLLYSIQYSHCFPVKQQKTRSIFFFSGKNFFLYQRTSQSAGFRQSGIACDIAFFLYTPNAYGPCIFEIEETADKPVLRFYGIKNFRQRCRRHQQKSCFPYSERISQGRMQSVDDCFQLCTDSVKIDGRSNDEHIGICQFSVYGLHVVILKAGIAFPFKTGIATNAGLNPEICDRHEVDLVILPCPVAKGTRQHFGIAVFSDTAAQHDNFGHVAPLLQLLCLKFCGTVHKARRIEPVQSAGSLSAEQEGRH